MGPGSTLPAGPLSWEQYETVTDIPSGSQLMTPLLDGFCLDVAGLFVP